MHTYLAAHHTVAHGNEATLLGTARFPGSPVAMTSWELPGAAVTGLLVWALAVAGRAIDLARRHPPGHAGIGLVANRPYWGLIMIPFAILWAGEEAADLVERYTAQRRAPGVALRA